MPFTDYTTPGSSSFTVPVAVKYLTVKLIGGGGAGNSGFGGGGGGYIDKTITTSPGTSISYQVGYGDTDGTYDTSQDSTWNGSELTAQGGNPGSGGGPGAGGGYAGTSYDHGAGGGAGGYNCNTSCDYCVSCNSYCCAYDSYMNCLSNCFSCSSTSNSSCGAVGGGGASGSLSGAGGNGNYASCSNNSNDSCGYCQGTSCSDGSPGAPADTNPGGYGQASPGGGGLGGSGAGGDGLVRVIWDSGYAAITTQPSNAQQNVAISPAIVVEIRFSDGSVDTSYNGNVACQIGTNPSSGTLSGTTTVSAVSGVATFSDLNINNIGVGYDLVFTSDPDVVQATSSSFNITTFVAFTPTYQVYSFDRPALEADQNLTNLRPSRAIR